MSMEGGGLETGRWLFLGFVKPQRNGMHVALINLSHATTEHPRDQQLILSMPELLLVRSES
jgi:hypothetical protein